MVNDEAIRSLELDELINLIDEPYRIICQRIVNEHGKLFREAPGSRTKHHAWRGGYHDHIVDAMNRAVRAYGEQSATGRLFELPRESRFSLSDVLVAIFLHDIEKPWKYVPDAWFMVSPLGPVSTKAERADVRWRIIEYYGFLLPGRIIHAILHAEGVRDADYSPDVQLLWPIGMLTHIADHSSAVYGGIFPMAAGDPLTGARRIASE